MEHDENREPEKKKDIIQDKTKAWIEKAEAFIDDASEKIHQSDAYRKAGKTVESATKKLFRQAGRWWGKSQQHFKK